MKNIFLLSILTGTIGFAQNSDEAQLKAIYNQALTKSQCYSQLDYLSNKI